ncbi:MAG: sugar ABC transporter permease [Subdoligranulum sp.]|nr:sugar ABC transporter permease [Subdoligranulum sp.]
MALQAARTRKKEKAPSLDGGSKRSLGQRIWRDRYLLLLFLPCLIYYILFKYVPMWGVLISFKDFKPFIGFAGSEWVGFKHYVNFFSNPDAWRVIRNTLLLGIYSLLWCFPFPIIFALVLNEITRTRFKKFVQTVSYMPHFLSAVVVCGMISSFLSPVRGIVNTIITSCGGEMINFLSVAGWFRTIYVTSEVWQTLGWSAIVYMAAISNVDPQYYEAARLDGASRLRQVWSITLPSIAPTVATMLILRVGSVLDVGLEKALLLSSPAISETASIIPTYVYNQGLVSGNMSYASAVGLFSSVVNLVLLVGANYVSKKFSETGLF